MEYLIKQYPLETGALEIQYIEEYFGEFPRKKTAMEIVSRLHDREFLILMPGSLQLRLGSGQIADAQEGTRQADSCFYAAATDRSRRFEE